MPPQNRRAASEDPAARAAAGRPDERWRHAGATTVECPTLPLRRVLSLLGSWETAGLEKRFQTKAATIGDLTSSRPTLLSASIDRSSLVARYRNNRARSRALFDLLIGDDVYYSQPIALRHPIVFYEGHLPAFSFNTLVKRALGQRGIDAHLEALFARGIDPETAGGGPSSPERNASLWPSRDVVRAFAGEADARVVAALSAGPIDVPGHPLLDRAEAALTILEHEVLHQETLRYMWHRLPLDRKRAPAGYRLRTDARVPGAEWIHVPAGRATLGVARGTVAFAWDNESPRHIVDVPAFTMARHDVTNAEFTDFVEAGGYEDERWWAPEDWAWVREHAIEHPLIWERDGDQWYWRAMFERVPMPPAWPVYVSHAEASAFARWRGLRLPSEAEFQRAAYGTPAGEERAFPWGDAEPTAAHGVFDFSAWDPAPIGTHAAGRSAWGFDDLVGNGWEWTRTVFAPFPGFRPMASYPEYSSDFFDGEHMIIKGASPATSRDVLRPSFRNWFRRQYPYVYATFRCVRPE